MSFIRNKFKYFVLTCSIFFVLLFLGLGIGLTLPGMGLNSQNFINSVDKKIDEVFPAEKIIINKLALHTIIVAPQVRASLQFAYESDVLSALTTEQLNNAELKQKYLDYADQAFEDRWGFIADGDSSNDVDIDLNTFSHELVQFDIHVAEQFHDYGYTHAGIQWIGQKNALGILLSPNYKNSALYQDAKNQSVIMKQSQYEGQIVGGYLTPKSAGVELHPVVSSLGTMLVNNKTWFINQQLRNTALLASLGPTKAIFLDKGQYVLDNIGSYDKSSDTYNMKLIVQNSEYTHPNFVSAFKTTRAGVVFLIILTPIILVLTAVSTALSFVYYPQGWNKK